MSSKKQDIKDGQIRKFLKEANVTTLDMLKMSGVLIVAMIQFLNENKLGYDEFIDYVDKQEDDHDSKQRFSELVYCMNTINSINLETKETECVD